MLLCCCAAVLYCSAVLAAACCLLPYLLILSLCCLLMVQWQVFGNVAVHFENLYREGVDDRSMKADSFESEELVRSEQGVVVDGGEGVW